MVSGLRVAVRSPDWIIMFAEELVNSVSDTLGLWNSLSNAQAEIQRIWKSEFRKNVKAGERDIERPSLKDKSPHFIDVSSLPETHENKLMRIPRSEGGSRQTSTSDPPPHKKRRSN